MIRDFCIVDLLQKEDTEKFMRYNRLSMVSFLDGVRWRQRGTLISVLEVPGANDLPGLCPEDSSCVRTGKQSRYRE